jgi:response regulator RpfG family c-di-GMP phosphodiesterase
MSLEETPILIIDDEEIVLLAISESLIPEGYRIVKTTNPHHALELLQQQQFAVIISDHHMPGMTGLEFFAAANHIQPLASRILITGVLTLKVVVDAINKGEIFRFIAKPWIREELLATVRNALHRYELISQNTRLQQETQQSNEALQKANQALETQVRDLSARLRQRDQQSGRTDQNLSNALELMLRVLHNTDPQLGLEASLIVRLCQSMIDTGTIPTDVAGTLKIASYLCTLGKLSIDRKRLKIFQEQTQLLKADELEYFHNIPVYAQLHASVFENIPNLSETVRASHERVDGRGYPDGLNARQIPEAAKYLAVAVHYAESHASTQATLDQIRQLNGNAFEPQAVATFLAALPLSGLNRKLRQVSLQALTPGMVIGEDLKHPSGAILLPKGSSLSTQTIQALRDAPRHEGYPSHLLIFS